MSNEIVASSIYPSSVQSAPRRGGNTTGARRIPASFTVRIVRHAIEAIAPAAFARAVTPLLENLRDYGLIGDAQDCVEIVLAQTQADNWGTQGTAVEIKRS